MYILFFIQQCNLCSFLLYALHLKGKCNNINKILRSCINIENAQYVTNSHFIIFPQFIWFACYPCVHVMIPSLAKDKVLPVLNYWSSSSALQHEDVWRSGCIAQLFLTSALNGGEWSASDPCHFTLTTHWIGFWVGPLASLDAMDRRRILPMPGIKHWMSSS
jgi:hypothetical protein